MPLYFEKIGDPNQAILTFFKTCAKEFLLCMLREHKKIYRIQETMETTAPPTNVTTTRSGRVNCLSLHCSDSDF